MRDKDDRTVAELRAMAAEVDRIFDEGGIFLEQEQQRQETAIFIVAPLLHQPPECTPDEGRTRGRRRGCADPDATTS